MKLLRKLRALFRKEKLDAEMSEELRTHLEFQIEENVARGMSAEEARYAALRQFGNVASIQERARDGRGWVGLENWMRDCKFSVRSLRRSPGFSGAAIVTSALCIGANTTIMSVLYGFILKPLPYSGAEQLVEIYSSRPLGGRLKDKVGVQQYLDYKAHADLFDGFALWSEWAFSAVEDGNPVRRTGARVTADYFGILGMQPLLGRFFGMDECTPGKDRVLVLTQTYWERTFHSDSRVIGRVIEVNGQPHTIIGVAPRTLEALNAAAAVIKPFEWKGEDIDLKYRGSFGSTMYGRIKPGVTQATALAQLSVLEKNFHDRVAGPPLRDYLTRNGFRMALGQVRAEQTKSIRGSLAVLQGGAFFVLLLGAVNVATLMLARSNVRQSEFAVRRALGAGRGPLARQMFVEGALLVGIGAAGAVMLAWASLRMINRYAATVIREVQPVALDGAVLGVTVASAILIAFGIVLLPLATVGRANLLPGLQAGRRTISADGRSRLVGGLLVTAQVALAIILLTGAGLLLRSFARVLAVDPGFDAQRVVQGRIVFGSPGQSRESVKAMQDLIVQRIREIPGVEKVGVTFQSPLSPVTTTSYLPIRGMTYGAADSHPAAMVIAASPEYFEAMGIRLLEGRVFTEDDFRPDARPVYVVDETFAARYFTERSAVGQTFDFGNPAGRPDRWPMVIGVVSGAKLSGLDDTSGTPFVFSPRPAMQDFSLVVRTARRANEIVPLMRDKLRSVDPGAPLFITGSLQDRLEEMLANRRGVMWLLAAFAGIALLLAAVGIYGLLAYDVAQRTKEIGIRGALGANRGQIIGLIVRQGLARTGVGIGLGLAGAYISSRYLRTLLFEIAPSDPVSFLSVALLLFVVALLACWLPARRASRIDPVVALRTE